MHVADKARDLGFIQFQRPKCVSKAEAVDHDTLTIRERIRRDNVHSPGCKRACNIREEGGSIHRHQHKFTQPCSVPEIDLYRIEPEVPCHFKVTPDLLHGPSANISLRKAFDVPCDGFGSLRHGRCNTRDQFRRSGPNTLLIDTVIKIIRSCDVQPPQIFGLPWRQRVRVYCVQVGVGEEQQHAQCFLSLHLARKGSDRLRVEDVAPQR